MNPETEKALRHMYRVMRRFKRAVKEQNELDKVDF